MRFSLRSLFVAMTLAAAMIYVLSRPHQVCGGGGWTIYCNGDNAWRQECSCAGWGVCTAFRDLYCEQCGRPWRQIVKDGLLAPPAEGVQP